MVPRGLAELLASRVQALGPQVAAALEAAAIAGREFDAGLVAGIAGIERDEAVAALDRAVDAQLVAALVDRPGRMSFVHDLVREALTVKLPPGRSAKLHARAVDVLAPRADDGADDGSLPPPDTRSLRSPRSQRSESPSLPSAPGPGSWLAARQPTRHSS